MSLVLAKNKRRCTRVQQSKFFVKALENTIKNNIPYKKKQSFKVK